MLIHYKEMPTGGSDVNLKKSVKPIKGSLKGVLDLKPVTWQWRQEEAGKGIQYGFIAQDVEAVFPDFVSEEEWIDGSTRKFLAADKITPLLVAALQEQQKQIAELEKIVETLKNQKEVTA